MSGHTPELLAALEALLADNPCLELTTGFCEAHGFWAQAGMCPSRRAALAIAKARGETP